MSGESFALTPGGGGKDWFNDIVADFEEAKEPFFIGDRVGCEPPICCTGRCGDSRLE